jgi:hypothetical protein
VPQTSDGRSIDVTYSQSTAPQSRPHQVFLQPPFYFHGSAISIRHIPHDFNPYSRIHTNAFRISACAAYLLHPPNRRRRRTDPPQSSPLVAAAAAIHLSPGALAACRSGPDIRPLPSAAAVRRPRHLAAARRRAVDRRRRRLASLAPRQVAGARHAGAHVAGRPAADRRAGGGGVAPGGPRRHRRRGCGRGARCRPGPAVRLRARRRQREKEPLSHCPFAPFFLRCHAPLRVSGETPFSLNISPLIPTPRQGCAGARGRAGVWGCGGRACEKREREKRERGAGGDARPGVCVRARVLAWRVCVRWCGCVRVRCTRRGRKHVYEWCEVMASILCPLPLCHLRS